MKNVYLYVYGEMNLFERKKNLFGKNIFNTYSYDTYFIWVCFVYFFTHF